MIFGLEVGIWEVLTVVGVSFVASVWWLMGVYLRSYLSVLGAADAEVYVEKREMQ